MRYTRYNYKPKRKGPKDNFFILKIVVLLSSIVIGLLLGKVIFKGGADTLPTNATTEEDKNKEDTNKDKEDTNKEESKGEKEEGSLEETGDKKEFIMIQCGYYGKKENAEKVLNDIPSKFNKFIVKEKDKYRVIAGIYSKEEGEKISNELTKKEILNVKIKSEYNISKKEESKVYETMNGFMKILNKLESEEVISVNTTDFKKWTGELFDEKELESLTAETKELLGEINKLPKELDKDGAKKYLEYIYKILIKRRV